MSSPANIGCPCLGGLHDDIVQFNGEENELFLTLFLFKCRFDFRFDPITLDGLVRKDDQEFVIEPDRLINAVSEFVSNFQIFRSKPAAYVFTLQIGIEPLGELLVFAGIVTVDKGIASLTAAPNRTGRFPFIRLLSVWSFVIDTLYAIFGMTQIMAMAMKHALVV
jgi:hypothetical protein